ncbi:MAG: FliM/FliN family flagellar motor C-terminal domain-containing protein [Planctomycetota bacterium]
MVSRLPENSGDERPRGGSEGSDDPALIARVRQLLERKLPFEVRLAEKQVSLAALREYSVGSLIVLKDVDPERIELSIDGTPIAEGTVVRVDNRLALRLDRVLTNREKLDALFVED